MVSWRIALCLGFVVCLISPTAARSSEPQPFRVQVISTESEFTSAAAIDINGDGKLDIVSGGWWYAAPNWERHKLRDVERIGTRFDDYSNLPMDVDADGDLDLISVNYRSKSIYWVRNPGAAAAISGQEWERVVIDTPGASETGRLVDIDADGQLDILPNGTTFAAWYSLEHTAPSELPRWLRHELPAELIGHGIGSGDINGDGRVDLVCTTGWAEAPANPRTDRWLFHPEFHLPRDGSVPILVHDVDGDGDMDLVWGRGHNVGVYWTEQHRQLPVAASKLAIPASVKDSPILQMLQHQTIWTTHAIDTSWSCAHAPLLADLDGDGIVELVAGKRYQGHEGNDPGENDPLRVTSYQFDKQSRTWKSRLVSSDAVSGLDLDPKCVDIDADGDLDIIAPARSGLVLLENLRVTQDKPVGNALAARELPLPEGISHHDFKSVRVARDGETIDQPIKTALDMGVRREQIMQQMETVMGRLPTSERRVGLDVRVERVEQYEKYARIKLTYAAEQHDRVPAWLLIPNAALMSDASATASSTRAAALLCLHPTHLTLGKDQLLGMGGKPSRFYAHELAQRGFVCLVPDYPGFGEYDYDFLAHRDLYASGTMKAIWNNIRGLDLLESLPCVRPDAIGCLGHSLGGHNALYTAAFDVRIRAVMSSCGFNTFADYYGGDLKGWTSDRYMPLIATRYGNDPQRMPFDFPEVLAAIAPRPLLVNAPLKDSNFAVVGVRKCEAAVRPLYEKLDKAQNVTFLYPDAEHDFPAEIREQTYDWFDKVLSLRR